LLASIPVAASLVMGAIAAFKLHVACKQCIGIYAASAVVGVVSFIAFRNRIHGPRRKAGPFARLWFLPLPLAALLVLVLTTSYVAAMPSYEKATRGCGSLPQLDSNHDVFVHLAGDTPGAHKVIEIFDPLCPACKAFEDRLAASGLEQQMQRDLLLFPLDQTCNWMVKSSVHPGACAVSMAVLCAGPKAKAVMDWAFSEQRELEKQTQAHPDIMPSLVAKRFPDLTECINSAVTKTRLSQSLRWAVKNRVPLLTPQLYVDGQRLCGEDTDLGLEYTLSRMLKGQAP
jgi:hypothetical protein